ncbi:sensor domain-containing diguanylate cyclase [Marinomonas ushuaiensis]|nr:sensor domain-containing diguanylate cyclase [Marinomonas ushuaiensis]
MSVSLRRLIIVPFFALALITGITMYFVATTTMSNIADKVGLQYIHEVESRVQERVRSFMSPLLRIVEVNQQSFLARPNELNDLSKAAIRFHEQGMPYRQMTFISIATSDGRYLTSVQPPVENRSHHIATNFVHKPLTMEGFEYDPMVGIGNKRQQDAEFTYDPRLRPFYQSAVGSKVPVWGEIERYYGYDALGATLSAAIYDDNDELLAITATSVALNALDEYLKSLEIVDGGYLFLAEGSGDLIATSSDTELFFTQDGESKRANLHEHQNDFFRLAGDHLEDGSYSLSYNGNEYLYYVHPVNFEYGETWLLGVLIPEAYHENLLSDYNRSSVLITLGLFIFISLLGALIAWYIGKPIQLLSAATSNKRLESIQALPESISSVKEINALNQGLKEMADDLSDVMHNLEAKVAERTILLQGENETLLESSIKDELTNIYNRRGLKQGFNRVVGVENEQKNSVTLVLCDIDHFKVFNDKYGHSEGDQALIKVAESLKMYSRAGVDIVARYGGEEFILVFSNMSLDHVLERLNGIRQELKNTELAGKERITMSFGVAHHESSDSMQIEDLINKADEKLYEAKNGGRNKIVS